jgi:hypothetical protein
MPNEYFFCPKCYTEWGTSGGKVVRDYCPDCAAELEIPSGSTEGEGAYAWRSYFSSPPCCGCTECPGDPCMFTGK